MKSPKVAIIGRSNVGKSSLFNKITEKRQALVLPEAGTTRDVLEAQVEWRDKKFTIVDTGGLDPHKKDIYHELLHHYATNDKEILNNDSWDIFNKGRKEAYEHVLSEIVKNDSKQTSKKYNKYQVKIIKRPIKTKKPRTKLAAVLRKNREREKPLLTL